MMNGSAKKVTETLFSAKSQKEAVGNVFTNPRKEDILGKIIHWIVYQEQRQMISGADISVVAAARREWQGNRQVIV